MDINERLLLFANELNDIQDVNLQQFAMKLLSQAPDYFFTVPASSSGKYHPYFAREVGGLVKHTRCVIFYAECNAESFNFDSHTKDLAIIAALSHDMKKQGNGNGKHTVWEHPELAYNFILDTQRLFPQLISVEDATMIANAVLCHMGKWQHDVNFTRGKKSFPLPTTLFEYAIQSADYMASRVELTGFAFRPTDSVSIPVINSSINETSCVVNKDEEQKFNNEKAELIKKAQSEIEKAKEEIELSNKKKEVKWQIPHCLRFLKNLPRLKYGSYL